MPQTRSSIKRNAEINRSKEIKHKFERTLASLDRFDKNYWEYLTSDESVHLATIKALLEMMAKEREGTH